MSEREREQELLPGVERFWPLWERMQPGKLASLASYVSPVAVRGLGLVSDRQDLGGLSSAHADAAMAERLYETLRKRNIAYGFEPWVESRVHQQIRDPRWTVSEDKYGTCLDVAVAYAAMCEEAHVGCLLAITSKHAFVIVAPGRLHRPGGPHKPFDLAALGGHSTDMGVAWFDDHLRLIEAVDAGDLLPIDCFKVTDAEIYFPAALELGRELIARESLHLVDVPWLHHGPYPPLDPPTSRPAISFYVPGSGEGFDSYDSHSSLLAELEHQSGTVALIGRSGQGKSTLAREVALKAESGAAWFLNASEPQALINSLAEAELRELNAQEAEMPSPDRLGYAYNALGRLANSKARYVVVLDNADGDPAKLASYLPEPRDNQLVLITTKNAEWERMLGVKPRWLQPVTADEIEDRLKDTALAELVNGRLLLVYAFELLIRTSGLTGSQIAAHRPGGLSIQDELTAPATFWAALKSLEDFADRERDLARHCAYIPPDNQPVAGLEEIDPDAKGIEWLTAMGLLRREAGLPLVSMHRLFGATVRADLESSEPEACDRTALYLASAEHTRQIYDVYGDLASIERLRERLEQIDRRSASADHELGVAMHSVAELLELHGHTLPSAELYELAERHLDGDRRRLADCMLGRARAVNQHPDRNARHLDDKDERRKAIERDLRAACELAEGAVRRGIEQQIGKALAMQGLLMKELASHPRTGETKLELLHGAFDVLVDADHRRRELAGEQISDTELARSRFNLAGIRVALAREERAAAAELLDDADAIYKEVMDIRKRLYGRDSHPFIAACVIGFAYTNYYRATLISALPWQRSRWLREATRHAVHAVRLRQDLDGQVDLNESRKAAKFLAKVAIARHAAPPRPRGALKALSDEALEELERVPVQPLPSDGRGLDDAIAAWASSPQLERLVVEFEGDPPGPATSLAERLEWLEEFSKRWDYRAGVERNLVQAPDISASLGAAVLEAAHALGLIGTADPPSQRYDHILILGGLVRACLTRPLHAANLLADEKFSVASVTALGGHRPLRGDELEMSAAILDGDLNDEFDAMNGGVRRAFSLSDPVSVRGEQSTIVGKAWSVHEYETASGLPVRVVAAPSTEPGVRRANTADTYEWFASELAHLAAGDRILVITSDIYVRFQHADALRMLALVHGVEVDAVGIQPGDLDSRLMQKFEPHNYLQEVRSTIRALHALHLADIDRGASG